ncbi:MAG: DNRLRE domain-containing protein [Candidatus Heimdallarchaeota archaeon]
MKKGIVLFCLMSMLLSSIFLSQSLSTPLNYNSELGTEQNDFKRLESQIDRDNSAPVSRNLPRTFLDLNTDLSLANASFLGESDWDRSGGGTDGYGVAIIGDVNNDNYADVLINAFNYSNGDETGKIFLVLGRASVGGWTTPLDLSNANASFVGENPDDQAGWSVAGPGDVNNDGYTDILISAPGNNEVGIGRGKTYLILGRADVAQWNGSDPLNLAYANASFVGELDDITTGYNVVGAGDMNNDTYADFLITSPGYPETWKWNGTGKAYLILGRADVTQWNGSDPLNLAYANASFVGEDPWDKLGYSTAAVGDINNDGYDDILFQAHQKNVSSGIEAGKAYLILGRADVTQWNGSDSLHVSNANASFIGATAGEMAGFGLAGAGDVNMDGYDDILIGAPMNNDSADLAGKTYLILGRADVTLWNGSAPLNLANANASFAGEKALDGSGAELAGVGDVNDDGYDDILISAGEPTFVGGTGKGKAYLIVGQPDPKAWGNSLGLASADASFIGENDGDAAASVAGGGDINNDGFDDFIIGASRYGATDKGKTYLILGDDRGGTSASISGEATPVQSGYVDHFHPDTNFYSEFSLTSLKVGGHTNFTKVPPDETGWKEAYIQFDLSNYAIPSGDDLVFLDFYRGSQDGALSGDYRVHAVMEAWNTTNMTWNNKPQTSAMVYGSIPGAWLQAKSNQFHQIEITGLVKSWLNSSLENYGLMIEANQSYGYFYIVSFRGVASQHPKLTTGIETVPNAPPIRAGGISPGDGNATLAWDRSNETGGRIIREYKIYRATTQGGPYTYVDSVTNYSGGVSYVDTGLTNDVTYYYVITAANKAGESPYSEEIVVTPKNLLPSAPRNLTAVAGGMVVMLFWNESLDIGLAWQIEQYRIYRGTTPGGPYTLIGTVVPGDVAYGYEDADVTSGTTYYYVVVAASGYGESAYSNEASATVEESSEPSSGPGDTDPDGTDSATATTPFAGWEVFLLGLAISSGLVLKRRRR